MRFILTTDFQVEKFKQSAKKLRRSNTLPHREALDKVAKANGYNHWHHVTICHQETVNRFGDGVKAGTIDPTSYVEKEVAFILGCAEKGDARLVKIGSLVFFSTEDGDAWMLDPADSLALCLRWRGERQEFSNHESPERFEIQWDGRFEIRDEAFFVESANPRIGVRTILGYPSTDIKDVLA